MKFTEKQLTAAYQMSARKYGFSVSAIRANTVLRHRAVREWREKFIGV